MKAKLDSGDTTKSLDAVSSVLRTARDAGCLDMLERYRLQLLERITTLTTSVINTTSKALKIDSPVATMAIATTPKTVAAPILGDKRYVDTNDTNAIKPVRIADGGGGRGYSNINKKKHNNTVNNNNSNNSDTGSGIRRPSSGRFTNRKFPSGVYCLSNSRKQTGLKESETKPKKRVDDSSQTRTTAFAKLIDSELIHLGGKRESNIPLIYEEPLSNKDVRAALAKLRREDKMQQRQIIYAHHCELMHVQLCKAAATMSSSFLLNGVKKREELGNDDCFTIAFYSSGSSEINKMGTQASNDTISSSYASLVRRQSAELCSLHLSTNTCKGGKQRTFNTIHKRKEKEFNENLLNTDYHDEVMNLSATVCQPIIPLPYNRHITKNISSEEIGRMKKTVFEKNTNDDDENNRVFDTVGNETCIIWGNDKQNLQTTKDYVYKIFFTPFVCTPLEENCQYQMYNELSFPILLHVNSSQVDS